MRERRYAAAITPLRDGGAALDEDAFAPYVDFLRRRRGSTGCSRSGRPARGSCSRADERKRAAELFIARRSAASRSLSTAARRRPTKPSSSQPSRRRGRGRRRRRDRAAVLRARRRGAAPRISLRPPRRQFRCRSTSTSSARATGYSIPLSLIERLGDRVAGLEGVDQPFEAVEPYLIEGLDVFIGAETLVDRGLELGAAGSVSGLAAAFPEGGAEKRAAVARALPVPGCPEVVLGWRGVPVREDVRRRSAR